MPRRTRRSSGEGSIYYREARKRWEARITVGHKDDGTPIRKTFTGRTRRDVVDRMEAAQDDVADGLRVADAATTLADWLTYWLDEIAPEDAGPSTLVNYRNIVRLYICPDQNRPDATLSLADVQLGQLTPQHVRKLVASLRDAGKSANTQRLARSVLRLALKAAVKQRIIRDNPADDVSVKRLRNVTAKRGMTAEQARRLLGYLEDTDNPRHRRLAPAIGAALSVGLRRGELLGLAWDDLRLDGHSPSLTVWRTLRRQPGVGLVVGEPKTKGSVRTVPLPAPTVEWLREQRRRQHHDREACPDGLWDDHSLGLDLVFRTEIGTPVDPDNFRHGVYSITAAALGERWSPHELRHSAASILLAQGVPLEVVSEILGHSSIRVTKDVYGHLTSDVLRRGADAMTDALTGDTQP